MKELLIPKLYLAFVEVLVIFIIVLLGMMYYSWQGIFLVNRSVDSRAVIHILQSSFFISIGFAVTYQITKSVLFISMKRASRTLYEQMGTQSRIAEIAIDTYLIFALILLFVPVRPVLQDRIVNSQDFYITEQFVKYDAFPSALLLLEVGAISSIILFFALKKNKKTISYMVFFILLGIGVVIVNNRPNYYARIFEARAAWKSLDYPRLMEKAKEALLGAQNNEDKGMAYYWMGVAANRMENPKLAIDYQKKSIESNPTQGIAYSSIAFAQMALKDYENASRSAALCIKNDKYYAWCYLAMFEYYFFSEVNMKKADEYLSLAERMAPESREIMESRKFFEKDRKEIEKLQKQGIRVIMEDK